MKKNSAVAHDVRMSDRRHRSSEESSKPSLVPAVNDDCRPLEHARSIDTTARFGNFNPSHVRYIKLGAKGAWAADAFRDGTLPFGYKPIAHEACLAWDEVTIRRQLSEMGRAAGGSVSNALRELKEFYTLPRDTLWVTMAHGHLWWAFADETVFMNEDPSNDRPVRYRKTRTSWSDCSLLGKPLITNSISSAIRKTTNYQQTMCEFEQRDFLIECISGKPATLHAAATIARKEMIRVTRTLIDRLDSRDFETLIDLIFSRGGWHRTSELGKGQADVDLILSQPITGETAWVQVKSTANQSVLNDYANRFRSTRRYKHFFFVCHKNLGQLCLTDEQLSPDHHAHIWTGIEVAEKTVAAGLFDWLKERV